MPVIQVAFEVTEDTLKLMQSGEAIRWGGVIRDTAGRIIDHLDEIVGSEEVVKGLAKPDSPFAGAAAKGLKVVKDNKYLFIGLGVVALGAGVAYVAHKKNKKKQKISPEEEQEKIIEDSWQRLRENARLKLKQKNDNYNDAFETYFKALVEKTMSLNVISDLRNQIESLLKGMENGDYIIQFENRNLMELATIFQNYANELRMINGFEVKDNQSIHHLDSTNLVKYMIQKLKEQEEVFVEVAHKDNEALLLQS